MTENASSTPLKRWIDTWLTHQRALGRSYEDAEWIALDRVAAHAAQCREVFLEETND